MNFNNYKLGEEIVKSLDLLGYKEPSEVQAKVIPEILKGNDVIVKSQTGSGKTAAFGIPIVEKVSWDISDPQVLVLTPTRELAIQVKEEISNIGRFKRIRTVAVFGKQPFSDQVRELKQRTHIVVGTPGRVMDHIDRGTLVLDQIDYLVIDEADEMLNMGFIDQVMEIIKELKTKRQSILLSATIPEEVHELSSVAMDDPVKVEIESKSVVNDAIDHRLYRVSEYDKFIELNKIFIAECPETAVVFCKTKENVDKVYDYLQGRHYSVNRIHGGLMQKERMDVMEKFKKGLFRILVATDVAARGIDVEGITHVINFDFPVEKEAYVHRIGRTGRAKSRGKALTLVNQFEDRLLAQTEEYLGFQIPVDSLPTIEEVKSKEKENVKILRSAPKLKTVKAKDINKNITKIYLNGGKKKKIRAGDIVGAISRISGIASEDIGIIDVQDTVTYVDILNGKGNIVIKGLNEGTIKGKKLKVERARK